MIEEGSMLESLKESDGDHYITFAGNQKEKVLGTGNIGLNSKFSLSKVLLVESLGYNLLSRSQLCASGFNCLFTNEGVTIIRRSDDSVAFKGVLKGKLYVVDFSQEKAQLDTCLVAKSILGWLWHHRLAQVGMRNLNEILKGDHILGLTNLSFEKDHICSACQAGKQVGVPHPSKSTVTTIKPLKLLHMDLFWPVAYIALVVINMVLSLLMIILISLGYSFCMTKVQCKIHSRNLQKELKMNLRPRSTK
jgi:hypothetical protein